MCMQHMDTQHIRTHIPVDIEFIDRCTHTFTSVYMSTHRPYTDTSINAPVNPDTQNTAAHTSPMGGGCMGEGGCLLVRA